MRVAAPVPDHLLDGLIAVTMLAMAWRLMTDPNLYRAIVLFVALGLFLAISWTRLAAPDIALADAAIGAGLTGVLLLDAIGHWDPSSTSMVVRRAELLQSVLLRVAPPRLSRVPAMLAVGGLAAVLVVSVGELPVSEGLRQVAHVNLGDSGVENPVTAVLLNYRGYDTWLEVVVLLLALLCVLVLRRSATLTGPEMPPFSPALSALARVAVPVALVIAGYVYAQGAHSPGGAFQAGAVIAAALVLLSLAGIPSLGLLRPVASRIAAVAAPAAFLAAIALTTTDGAVLEYRGTTAKAAIYLLEAAVAVGTAVTLLALFAASAPGRADEPGARPS